MNLRVKGGVELSRDGLQCSIYKRTRCLSHKIHTQRIIYKRTTGHANVTRQRVAWIPGNVLPTALAYRASATRPNS